MSDLTPPGPPPEAPPPLPPPPGPSAGNPYGQGGTSYAPAAPANGQRPGDAALGWTAFGLAVACCVPLLPLVAAVLAVVTLARRRFRPRWLAVVTLLLGLAGTVLQVALVTSDDFWEGLRDGIDDSLEDEAQDARDSGEPTEIAPIKLRKGDCFNDSAVKGAGDEEVVTETVTLLPCRERHDLEVYSVFDMPEGDYPGQAAVARAARQCLVVFREFVGTSYAASELEVFHFYPTSQTWNLLGDRSITCTVGHPRHPVRGSLEGHQR